MPAESVFCWNYVTLKWDSLIAVAPPSNSREEVSKQCENTPVNPNKRKQPLEPKQAPAEESQCRGTFVFLIPQ